MQAKNISQALAAESLMFKQIACSWHVWFYVSGFILCYGCWCCRHLSLLFTTSNITGRLSLSHSVLGAFKALVLWLSPNTRSEWLFLQLFLRCVSIFEDASWKITPHCFTLHLKGCLCVSGHAVCPFNGSCTVMICVPDLCSHSVNSWT